MSQMISAAPVSFFDRVVPASKNPGLRILLNVLLVVASAQLLWLSAKVQVPFYPVPMTMQTYAILVLAGLLGWKRGGMAVALYLAEGAMGLPVFAGTPEKGLGIAYMMGPTGGYLVGFVLAALVAGYFAQARGKLRFASVSIGMVLAHLAVFVPGILWLATLMNGGFEAALTYNLTQFGWATLLKTGLAIASVYAVWQLPVARGKQISDAN